MSWFKCCKEKKKKELINKVIVVHDNKTYLLEVTGDWYLTNEGSLVFATFSDRGDIYWVHEDTVIDRPGNIEAYSGV